MERKYGNLTTEIMDMCHSEKDTLIVLKQICWNLSCIADELAELNRVNSKTIGEIVEDLSMHGLKPEDNSPGLETEIVDKEKDVLGGKCFICGKPLDHKNVGGALIDSDGSTYCACFECKKKFGNLVSNLVMPNSFYM